MDISDLSGPPQDRHGIVLLSLFWLIGQGRFLRCARCARCARRARCGSRPGLAQEGEAVCFPLLHLHEFRTEAAESSHIGPKMPHFTHSLECMVGPCPIPMQASCLACLPPLQEARR
jgi:hypothetical protein